MKQSIGEFLATLRRANGYTQQEVADKLGISNRTLSAWERGAAMPDILLLPALADLYGVTVDEILGGERNGGIEKPSVTQKSQNKIYKRKLAKFTSTAYVLAGLMCLGLLLFYIGMHIDITTLAWVGWQWWLLLFYIGMIMFIVSAVVLFAIWRGNENSFEEGEDSHQFIVGLRFCVSNCSYASSVVSLLCAVVGLATLYYYGFLLFIIFIVITVSLFIFAMIVRRSAIKKYGSDKQKDKAKKNNKFFKKCVAFAMIPIGISLVGIVVFCLWMPIKHIELYSDSDAQSFKQYLESWQYPYDYVGDDEESEVYYNLTELAETGKVNEVIDLGHGVQVLFSEDKSSCAVQYRTIASTAEITVERVSTRDGSFSVYNLRFSNISVSVGGMASALGYYLGDYMIVVNGDNYQLVREVYYNYSAGALVIGGVVIAATLITLLVIFLVLQNKLKISD